MRFEPEHLHQAAIERIEQAQLLYTARKYALSMSISGVAVECLFRAMILERARELDTGHDIKLLYDRSRMKERLLQAQEDRGTPDRLLTQYSRQLESAVVEICLLWANSYRYASEDRLRRDLRKRRLWAGVRGDILKANCLRLLTAAELIVKEGTSP